MVDGNPNIIIWSLRFSLEILKALWIKIGARKRTEDVHVPHDQILVNYPDKLCGVWPIESWKMIVNIDKDFPIQTEWNIRGRLHVFYQDQGDKNYIARLTLTSTNPGNALKRTFNPKAWSFYAEHSWIFWETAESGVYSGTSEMKKRIPNLGHAAQGKFTMKFQENGLVGRFEGTLPDSVSGNKRTGRANFVLRPRMSWNQYFQGNSPSM